MKQGNEHQNELNILNDAVGRFLDKKPNLKNYQAEIDCLLDNACDLGSRWEIMDILYKSKRFELMEKINHLKCLLDNYG